MQICRNCDIKGSNLEIRFNVKKPMEIIISLILIYLKKSDFFIELCNHSELTTNFFILAVVKMQNRCPTDKSIQKDRAGLQETNDG